MSTAASPSTPTTSPSSKGGFLYRIDNEIELALPPVDVYDFVTTPALWSLWHPATVAVFDTPERPLLYGETAFETIRVGRQRINAEWMVIACEVGQLWSIATDTPLGEARITYRFARSDRGCRFVRTLSYRSRHAPQRWFDNTLVRWRLKRQSAQALRNLKQVLEGPMGPMGQTAPMHSQQ